MVTPNPNNSQSGHDISRQNLQQLTKLNANFDKLFGFMKGAGTPQANTGGNTGAGSGHVDTGGGTGSGGASGGGLLASMGMGGLAGKGGGAAAAGKGLMAGMGGPLGVGILGFEAMFVTMALMGNKSQGAASGVEKLNHALAQFNQSTLNAGSAIHGFMINVDKQVGAMGGNMSRTFGGASAFAAIGSQNPLGSAQQFAGTLRGNQAGMAIGQMNTGFMMGVAGLGMNPYSMMGMDPSDVRMGITDHLARQTKAQRQSPWTRGHLGRAFGEEQAADIIAMSNLPKEWRDKMDLISMEQRDFMKGPAANMVSDRAMKEGVIQAKIAAKDQQFQIYRENARHGFGSGAEWAEFKAGMHGAWIDSKAGFWEQAGGGLANFRDAFSKSINPELKGQISGMAGGIGKAGGGVLGGVGALMASGLGLTLTPFAAALGGAQGLKQAAGHAMKGEWKQAWNVDPGMSGMGLGLFEGSMDTIWDQLLPFDRPGRENHAFKPTTYTEADLHEERKRISEASGNFEVPAFPQPFRP